MDGVSCGHCFSQGSVQFDVGGAAGSHLARRALCVGVPSPRMIGRWYGTCHALGPCPRLQVASLEGVELFKRRCSIRLEMVSVQVSVLALLLTSCVTLDKSLHRSVLEFAVCCNRRVVAELC